jgi:hypothetical protein
MQAPAPSLCLLLVCAAVSGGTPEQDSVRLPARPSAAGPEIAPEDVFTRVYVEIPAQSLESYVSRSDEIVRGLVTGMRPVFPPEGIAYTEVDVWVLSSVGGRSERMLTVRVGGAEDGDRRVEVVGAPRFVEGEEVLLFLMRFTDPRTGAEYHGIRGLDHGTYRVPLYAGADARRVFGLHASGEPDLATFETRVRALHARLDAVRTEAK